MKTRYIVLGKGEKSTVAQSQPLCKGQAALFFYHNYLKQLCYEENVFCIPFLFSQAPGSSANTHLLQVNIK